MATRLYSGGVQFPDGTFRTAASLVNYGQRAIFGFGYNGSNLAVTNLVSNTGSVSSDVAGVGTAKRQVTSTSYGDDKGMFFAGNNGAGASISNLISNTGAVASDTNTTSSVPAQNGISGAPYGGDKGIFLFGDGFGLKYLVSNIGVIGSGAGTLSADTRSFGASTGYGGDKAIYAFGVRYQPPYNSVATTNLISNTGEVLADVTAVSGVTAKGYATNSGATYGGDKGIFAFVVSGSLTTRNLVSNTGVIASDSASPYPRWKHAGASYGGDKAIFAFGTLLSYFGSADGYTNNVCLVSNVGVIASDTTGIGTAREELGATCYGA